MSRKNRASGRVYIGKRKEVLSFRFREEVVRQIEQPSERTLRERQRKNFIKTGNKAQDSVPFMDEGVRCFLENYDCTKDPLSLGLAMC